MKRILTFLIVALSMTAFAQIQTAPPVGSKTYGTTVYLSPDGLIWFGTNPLKYRGVYPKTKVDSLLSLIPVFNASLYYTKVASDARFYPLTTNPAGYLTSFIELDPSVPAYAKSLTGFNIIKTSTDALYELLANKQNSLAMDGTGIKYPTVDAVNSSVNAILPQGELGQTLRNTESGNNQYIPYDNVVEGSYITTDEELDAAKEMVISKAEIFNTWKRYAIGGNPTTPQGTQINGRIPVIATQTNSWNYDSVNDEINSTFNTGSHIGFVSNKPLVNYIHKATLTVTPGATFVDNDIIGLVMAFNEDPNDQVINRAFGLNPSDFSWPIDVTSPTIPNQHHLVIYRKRNGLDDSYTIRYNFNNTTNKVIKNGSNSGVWGTTSSWVPGVEVDVEVIRIGDVITVRTTDFSDAPGGKGALRFPLTIDLNDFPELLKFKGPQRYGYMAQSQENASYKNISINDGINEIYDLRDGSVWIANSDEGYEIAAGRNIFNELLPKTVVFNPSTRKYIYVSKSNDWQIINSIGINNLQSVTNGTGNNITSNTLFVSGVNNIGTPTNEVGLYKSGTAGVLTNWSSGVSTSSLILRPQTSSIAGSEITSRIKFSRALTEDEGVTLGQLNEALPNLSNYVNTTGNQTGISGDKTWAGDQLTTSGKGFYSFDGSGGSSSLWDAGFQSVNGNKEANLSYLTGLSINTSGTSTASAIFKSDNLTAARTLQAPNASGTLALTSDLPNVNNYVNTTGNQVGIAGNKTWTGDAIFTGPFLSASGTQASFSYNQVFFVNPLGTHAQVLHDNLGATKMRGRLVLNKRDAGNISGWAIVPPINDNNGGDYVLPANGGGTSTLAIRSDILYGSTVVVMNGTDMVFTIPHGMGVIPSSLAITFGDASNQNFVQSIRTVDANNITLTCTDAPIAGSQTVYWQVFR